MVNPANATTFNRIKALGSSWTGKLQSSISFMGSDPTNTYYESISSANVNSVITYNSNKVVAVIFQPSSNTLSFRKNIVDNSAGQDKFMVIFVDGNVSIDSTVDRIDAFIIASGTITVESAGLDLDDPILIKGGLYANQILLNRDLKNVVTNNDKPAEYISYNENLILNQQDVPFEIKESPIQWVFDE